VLALRAALAFPAIDLVLTATSGASISRLSRCRTGARNPVAHIRARRLVFEPRAPDRDADLRSLSVPTLLIRATRDPMSPPAVRRDVAGLLPDATLLELDDDATCSRASGRTTSHTQSPPIWHVAETRSAVNERTHAPGGGMGGRMV